MDRELSGEQPLVGQLMYLGILADRSSLYLREANDKAKIPGDVALDDEPICAARHHSDRR